MGVAAWVWLLAGWVGLLLRWSAVRRCLCRFSTGRCVFEQNGLGLVFAAIAIVFFGSNFVVTKKYKTGDGLFFQWIMASAILVVGFIVWLVPPLLVPFWFVCCQLPSRPCTNAPPPRPPHPHTPTLSFDKRSFETSMLVCAIPRGR